MAAISLPIIVKRASELQGLTFGNAIHDLLPAGLPRHSLSFLYGGNCGRMMNILCANSVRVFGSTAIFVDAYNSADPYFVARFSKKNKKTSDQAVWKILESILLMRAFTPYQLFEIVARKLQGLIGEKKVHSVFVSGISGVFNERDYSKEEIQKYQLLLASRLRGITEDRTSEVQFVVASSDSYSERFVSESTTVVKFSVRNAALMKSGVTRCASVEL